MGGLGTCAATQRLSLRSQGYALCYRRPNTAKPRTLTGTADTWQVRHHASLAGGITTTRTEGYNRLNSETGNPDRMLKIDERTSRRSTHAATPPIRPNFIRIRRENRSAPGWSAYGWHRTAALCGPVHHPPGLHGPDGWLAVGIIPAAVSSPRSLFRPRKPLRESAAGTERSCRNLSGRFYLRR